MWLVLYSVGKTQTGRLSVWLVMKELIGEGGAVMLVARRPLLSNALPT